MDLHLDRIKNIPVEGWVLVAAGFIFGGGVIAQSRLAGGLIVGGLAFAYELSKAPCCSSCAGGAKACAGTDAALSTTTTSMVGEQIQGGMLVGQQQVSTMPLSNDYAGTAPDATVDPSSVWQAPSYSTSDNVTSDNAPASSGCMGCS